MAFDISNYQEKYRWDGYDTRKRAVRLSIYERTDEVLTPVAIRGLVDIKLQMQGSSEPVYAPIVKTSLMFGLVDAPDLAQPGEKSGDWQEFFTPDSTLYLVELRRGSTVDWRGYITPDSWRESLSYRGTVTITARDNIGHLQDIPFSMEGNADGLVQISQVIDAALDVIDFPMTVSDYYDTGDAQTLRDSHGLLIDAYVAVSEFEGGSWLDALEKVLISTGYTLRFVGNATENLAPIRNIPLGINGSRAGAVSSARAVEFYGGDREKDPAARQIVERIDYGSEMEVDATDKKSWRYGASTAQTYSGTFGFYAGPGAEVPTSFTGRSWKNGNTDFATRGGWSDTFGYLNPQRCTIGPLLRIADGVRALDMGVGIAAGQTTDSNIIASWKVRANSTDVTLRLEFARTIKLDNGSYPHTAELFVGYLKQVVARVSYVDPNGATWWWTKNSDGTGSWAGVAPSPQAYDVITQAPADIPDTFALDIRLADISSKTSLGGWLQIDFHNFKHNGIQVGTIYGLFDRCTAVKVTLNAKSILKSDTVTTVNDSNYNVRLERKPAFAAMSAAVPWFAPSNYAKALWVYSFGLPEPADYAFYFNGYDATKALPLPVQIHKQMLCYCHTPQDILTGTCGAVNKSQRIGFEYLASYKGKLHIIQGGTLDVLRNRISGVVMHAFDWYGDLWDEDNNPEYSGVPKYDTDSARGGANGWSDIAARMNL